MPFQSRRQSRYLFAKANEPGSGITMRMAREFARHTDYGRLPERKGAACRRLAKRLAEKKR